MKKKMLSLALALMMCLGLTVPALAAGTAETIELDYSTITVHDVLRKETVSFPFLVDDYDELDEDGEPTTKVSTWDLTVYIVDSEDYVTFDVKAKPGFEYSDNVAYAPSGGSYASIAAMGYQWSSAGGFAECDFGYMYLTGPETLSWGYPYAYDLSTWEIDESSRVPYLMNFNDDNWFMTESDFATVTAAQPSQPNVPSTPTTPTAPATSAVLSPQKLEVDGVIVDCEKYNIDGSNYFKLRDLAQLLSGTGSQFEVGYDGASNTVTITTGAVYTPAGGELATGADNSATAQPSAQSILIDGAANSELTVYNIGGSNFFQLRELGNVLGFEVDYNVSTDTAIVRSIQK